MFSTIVSRASKIIMNAKIATMPTEARYDVRERLGSGTVVTHLTGVSYAKMRGYVNRVWIHSVPPMFIITQA